MTACMELVGFGTSKKVKNHWFKGRGGGVKEKGGEVKERGEVEGWREGCR